jgi:hypothetical protein
MGLRHIFPVHTVRIFIFFLCGISVIKVYEALQPVFISQEIESKAAVFARMPLEA